MHRVRNLGIRNGPRVDPLLDARGDGKNSTEMEWTCYEDDGQYIAKEK